jgi:predicted nucleotidyltransferase component of viral defense system
MIIQKEIIIHAEKEGVDKSVIDKDWVLGHLLNSIFGHSQLKNILVFKGGTCLKKCFFPNYRFSEDLDFTLTDQLFSLSESIVEEILIDCKENSGILFSIDSFSETFSDDIKQGFEVILKYWGADHKPNQMILPSERWTTYVKLDISFTEELIFPVDYRELIHPYSDKKIIGDKKIPCYCIEEMFSEKMRSVLQRNRPRDYFDISFLKNNTEYSLEQIKAGFIRKSTYKNIDYSQLTDLLDENKIKLLNRHWDASLKHQISDKIFPEPLVLLNDLSLFFNKLFDNK